MKSTTMKGVMARYGTSLTMLVLFVMVLGQANQRVTALKLKPTTSKLMFEVGNEEVCLYASNHDHFEGVMMHYELVQGDVEFDVFIRDSHDKILYASFAGEHQASGRVYFTTRQKQQYAFCIDNRGHMTPKKLFQMEIGFTSLKRWKPRLDPLRKLMTVSDGLFLGLQSDQMIMRLREQIVRDGLEKTFTMLVVHGVTETVIVVIVAILNTALLTYLVRQTSV